MAASSITPFRIHASDEAVEDLRRRLGATRFPDRETPDDWSQGIPLDYVRSVCDYWAKEYDWRAREAELNRFAQFVTPIDGLDIHFIHERSPHEEALPLVMTHGWPGSVVEFQKVIRPLTHADDPKDAFHVVCPSLPGFGFSGKPTAPGWSVDRIAAAWAELMARLGYGRYVAQGGDWGSAVTTALGGLDEARCAGIHVNMVAGRPDPATMDDLTETEQAALAALKFYRDHDSGYSKQQSTRPQTLGYGLADSPSGQAAWILEKFYQWTDCNGHPENVLSRDELLDNVMVYWLTNSAASSARLYWESFNSFSAGKIGVPTGCSIFPKEIFRASRRWAEQRYSNIVYWNELERGGHFAAFEQPELFVGELRACFRLMR